MEVLHMDITTVSVKRININSKGFHILAINTGNNFYRFQIQHDKYASVFVMFGGDAAQANNDETLFAIAYEGFQAYKNEYEIMLQRELENE
jgi:hypothetical protein